ncbi:50S ribosomal protein L25/general stress protein Ctc [Maritalea mediterranea]|uniref:Large ribosomal subunit protein bL25 n=1 Tax=Maritalea mediterranea TaxID=2909667 RepID=A0ABS9E856_9HYPH|nr:50S ribosomal protein L25/general stress protein Ctc [Maritalea mediterranea]MCF4099065.1 50S ribosomal protein L25/general stress protein Ctc [Maritalea mediterranea]
MSAELKAKARDRVGKGASRALRREGLVPAVIYGDNKSPLSITVTYKDAIKRIHQGGFLSQVITVDVDGESHRVIPRDYQLEPVRDFLVHIDFLRVSKTSVLNVEVPVHFLNEEKSPGLKRGGVLNVVRHTVELSCPADSIPEALEIDLSTAEVGDSLHISSVALPEGVKPVITDRDFTIATIAAPSALKSEEGEEDEEAVAPDEVPATEVKSDDDNE